jgi:hypothetical protein
MKSSLLLAISALIVSLFVRSAMKVGLETTPARTAVVAAQVDDSASTAGYWAAWSEAASH